MATQNQYTLAIPILLRHKCQQFYVSDKIINNNDKIIKCVSYSEISAILSSLISVYKAFYLILENMGENVVFLVIFDTCDVMYNWSISLLPPIVLDNLFEFDVSLSVSSARVQNLLVYVFIDMLMRNAKFLMKTNKVYNLSPFTRLQYCSCKQVTHIS